MPIEIPTWMWQTLIIISTALLLAWFVGRSLRKLIVRMSQRPQLWLDLLLESAEKPLHTVIWSAGLVLSLQRIAQLTATSWSQYLPVLQQLLIVLNLAWWLTRFFKAMEVGVQDERRVSSPMDKTTAMALSRLLRLSVYITTVLIVLQTLGFSISGVLAFGGIGGIAVGFAAKDLLANFFGGLMVYLDRPFKVGDWIRSPDQDIEGTVEHIGWRVTRIRTFDKRPLYVPNATFTNITVENPSRMTHRRIYESFGVRYDDVEVVERVVSQVKAYIMQHQDLATDQTVIVNVNGFGASSIDFFVYCFTKTTNWIQFHQIKQQVLMDIIRIIEGAGASMAYPTQRMLLESADTPVPDMLATTRG